MDKPLDMQAVIDAARQGVAPIPVDLLQPALYLPNGNGGKGELVSLERFLGSPLRKRGEVVVHDPASFNQVVRDNADAGDVAIFVDRDVAKPQIVAVLNGHGKGGPGWGDFRVRIAFRPNPQWVKWQGLDGKLIGQTEFAEFVEDNLADIVTPAAAQMLEIVTQFQATRTTAMRRAIRLSSGQVQFEHVDNIDAKVGAGHIEVPEEITLSLAPMLGSPLYQVPARFRYRLAEGSLKLGIKLQRIEDLMRSVIDDVVQKIEVSTNVSVLEGQPPHPVTAA